MIRMGNTMTIKTFLKIGDAPDQVLGFEDPHRFVMVG